MYIPWLKTVWENGLDCYKTLPQIATTIDWTDYQGLFHGFNENSREVAGSLSSVISTVRRSVSVFCIPPPWFTIDMLRFVRHSDLYWYSSEFLACANVCVGTTSDPEPSRISR
jgi:hypothetical protein